MKHTRSIEITKHLLAHGGSDTVAGIVAGTGMETSHAQRGVQYLRTAGRLRVTERGANNIARYEVIDAPPRPLSTGRVTTKVREYLMKHGQSDIKTIYSDLKESRQSVSYALKTLQKRRLVAKVTRIHWKSLETAGEPT